MSLTDSLITYRILQILTTPFSKTDAFKYGLIDINGNEIKKAVTSSERDAMSILHRVLFRIKRVMPDKSMATIAAAAKTVREHMNNEHLPGNLEEEFLELVESNKYKQLFSFQEFIIEEDGGGGDGGYYNPSGIQNSTANVQGLRTDPVVSKKRQRRLIRRGKGTK